MKFTLMPAEEIESYYSLLKNQQPDKPELELFEEFCNDLYIDFGRPHLCTIKKIIRYNH